LRVYLIKVFVFLAILLVVDAGLFLGSFQLSGIFLPEEMNLLNHNLEVKGIILGTSHAEQGLMPSVLEKETGLDWYNFARARRNLVFNEVYSKALWQAGLRPKVVVLVATYHDWNEGSHPHMIRPFLFGEDLGRVSLDFLTDRQWNNPRTWLTSDQYSSTHRMMLARTLSWVKNRRTDLPYRPHPEDGFDGSLAQINPGPRPDEFPKHPWSVKESNRNAFIATLAFWTQKQVPVVVVDPPEFLGSRLSHRDYDTYRGQTERLCKEFGVPYKSFNELGQPIVENPDLAIVKIPDLSIVENPALFRDGGWGHPNSHLNTEGARRFSKDFSAWLLQAVPGLTSRPLK